MTMAYRNGPYLIMKLVVDDAKTDMKKVLTGSNSAEYAEKFLTLASCLEFLEMEDKVRVPIPQNTPKNSLDSFRRNSRRELSGILRNGRQSKF